ncbi:MAG: ParB/RepB/Spo0J family partition protein [Nitrospina sp.]|jgi:ParB family transcriptional regulator, chromosome partitioning protein|nr:ParB/RepB/Spo0J family partition protein [Nitrospina sp.]MBT3981702.1 ParB/RepB/Spo0J family partition protein [Bacteriovoracaceae bacterium]MBT4258584.1 ParB/RepB/Spo0J family partition protein [Nitrospina sp.]MBT4621578.1 ParB/RepB/Spo0J family partition protein [Nitrospina sp.]
MNKLIISVPVANLQAHPIRARKTETDVTKLTESIKSSGILQPILVCPNGQPDHYYVIKGWRRVEAARKAGLKEIPALIEPKANNSRKLSLIASIQREGILPLEKAEAIRQALRKGKIKQKDLAKDLGIKKSTVSQNKKIAKMPKAVKEEIKGKHSKLSFSTLRDLSKLNKDTGMETLKKIEKGEIEPTHDGVIESLKKKAQKQKKLVNAAPKKEKSEKDKVDGVIDTMETALSNGKNLSVSELEAIINRLNLISTALTKRISLVQLDGKEEADGKVTE